MTRLIGLAILLLPPLEIAGFILVSRWIGLPGVLLAVIAGAVGGYSCCSAPASNTVTRLRQAIAEGREPGRSLIDGACFAAAGCSDRSWILQRYHRLNAGIALDPALPAAPCRRQVRDTALWDGGATLRDDYRGGICRGRRPGSAASEDRARQKTGQGSPLIDLEPGLPS